MGFIWVIVFVATFANHQIATMATPAAMPLDTFDLCEAAGEPISEHLKAEDASIKKITWFCVGQPDADPEPGI